MIDIDTIFAEDREQQPSERSLPWEESPESLTVVVEPKPHWASDMLVFKLATREYCYYRDWAENGTDARFYDHIDSTGDDVMMKARAMIVREIADGLWRVRHSPQSEGGEHFVVIAAKGRFRAEPNGPSVLPVMGPEQAVGNISHPWDQQPARLAQQRICDNGPAPVRCETPSPASIR